MVVLKSIGVELLSGLGAALLGMFLIPEVPENRQDKAAEEATTGLLIVGPFVGLMTAFGGASYYFTSHRGS